MKVSPLVGKPSEQNILVNIPCLVAIYYTGIPDISVPGERVAFGTSGHRGSSFKNSFNENHILAITQAIYFYRLEQKINGPLFLGFDTHALSASAFATKSKGLLNPNHYLSVAIFYLLQNRPQWANTSAVGKTVVTTQLIDRIAAKLDRKIFDVPVGFKWFVDGLQHTLQERKTFIKSMLKVF